MVLSLTSLPGMKPTWSSTMSLGNKGRRWLAKILAKNLRSTFSREIGRSLVTSEGSLFGFGITVLCAVRRSRGGGRSDVRELNTLRKCGLSVSIKVL